MTPEELKAITDKLYTPALRHSLKTEGGWHPLIEMKRNPTYFEQWQLASGMQHNPPYIPRMFQREIFHLRMIGYSEVLDDLLCFVELDVTWKQVNLLLITGQFR